MFNKSKNSEDDFILQLANIFGMQDKSKVQDEIDKAQKNSNKSNSITSILKNYQNRTLDNVACQQILYDIISKLINLREDFKPIMKIYLLTTDKMKSDILRNHFVLKEDRPKKIENGDTNDINFIEFYVDLSCTYDEDSYYKKFIQGILNYFKLVFKENYLYEYIERQCYFNFLNKCSSYKENRTSLEKSLKNMLVDMSRIIAEQSNTDKNKNIKSKMSKAKYGVFLIREKLHKDEKLIKIYENNDNNDDILKAVDELLNENEKEEEKENGNDNKKDEELHSKLLLLRDDIYTYIQQEMRDNDIKIQLSINNSLIYENEKEIKDLKKANNNLNTLVKEFNKNISQLNSRINNYDNQITQLKGKVEFMEPIVLSLICRKAINHCIIKILEKYKSKIKITKMVVNNDFNYKIEFIASVNNISIVNLNRFIDNMFTKKDIFNQESYLINKDLPKFINDLWSQVKKNLKLEPIEKTIFDAMITTDIKSCFNFGGEDLSVTNYLKNIDINEFGKEISFHSK